MKKQIKVMAGIVIFDGKILIAQRKKGKLLELLWEFPGGKLEEGETFEECLRREFIEEFDLKIEVGEFFKKVDFEYALENVSIDMFFATCLNKTINKITAHEKIAWVKPKQLIKYDLVPADALIVDELLEHLQNSSQSLS